MLLGFSTGSVDRGICDCDYISKNIDGFSETEEFPKKIQALRKCGGFGVVLKGLTCLDWGSFRHQQGAFVLGSEKERYLEKKRRKGGRYSDMFKPGGCKMPDMLMR